ncbi:uncharacterized protein LOC131634937 [Vicia villosa]|uniref:uncharacterized protein LOC131634937 n=1 Tax=Vicia villosa TaxID=3911 RepID=UPI00273AE50B|nr:uncharacterized protein LOC131634937 [Vicia villosa]
MAERSKDLLQFEHKKSSLSPLETALLVCDNNNNKKESNTKIPTHGTPLTAPLPPSQLLGKVKDFLGVMSEANKQLENDAKDNPEKYDIEGLVGNESEVIEMDLMLGVADLHTPEAVAAAESAISGSQQVISLPVDGSEKDSDEESSDDNDDDDDDDGKIDRNLDGVECGNDGKKSSSSLDQKPVSVKDDVPEKQNGNRRRSKKRPAIVELS